MSVDGTVGPLHVDRSTRADVLAYAGEPNADRHGRGDPSRRYEVLGYGCARDPDGRSDSLVRCRTAFYLVGGKLGLFFTRDPRYLESHGVRVGMPTKHAERLLHARVPRTGCEPNVYLASRRAHLTVAFGRRAVDALYLHSRRHDPGVTDCA